MNEIFKQFREKIKAHKSDIWLIAITAYGLFQSIITIQTALRNLSAGALPPVLAGINTFLLLVSFFVLIGAIGIILLKKWGLIVTRFSYMAVILMILQIIYINQKSGVLFYINRAIDITIAIIIICYLTRKEVLKNFR